nr:glycosyltransferase [uncultured Desulfobacter sp.]
MKKIRVMHLIHQLNPGGAENGVVNIANGFDKKAFEISICTFSKGGLLLPRLHNDVTVFEIEKRDGNDIRIPFKVYQLLKDWQPDIIHTHSWGTLLEGFIPSIAAGVPIRIHGEHGTIQKKTKQKILQKLFFYLAHQVLSVSVEHKTRLARTIGFPKRKIEVIDNGVDNNRFSPKEFNTREEFGIDDKTTVIGTVGRMEPVKNQILLINAFKKLLLNRSNIKLILIGDGALLPELKARVSDYQIQDHVIFTGQRFDTDRIFNTLNIFVLPSLSEGMSNTILEAMSCGLPVVATDVGDNHRLVDDDTTGYLIPSDSVDALTDKLNCLIDSVEKQTVFGANARQKIKSHFSLDIMVKNYERLYYRLLN